MDTYERCEWVYHAYCTAHKERRARKRIIGRVSALSTASTHFGSGTERHTTMNKLLNIGIAVVIALALITALSAHTSPSHTNTTTTVICK